MKFTKPILLICNIITIITPIIAQDTLYLKANAYIIKQMPDSALYCYSLLIAQKAKPEYYIEQGELLYTQKKYSNALTNFINANNLKADIASFQAAKCLANLGKNTEAIKMLQNHLESNYRLPPKTVRLDEAFTKLEQTAEWNTLWSNDWYSKTEMQASEAQLLFESGNYDELINLVSEACLKSPKHQLLYWRAKAYFELNSLQGTIDDLNMVISLQKREILYFELRANCYLFQKKYTKAIDDLNVVLKLKPVYFSKYLLRANALAQLKQYDNALADIAIYQKYFPNNENGLFEAGNVWAASENYFKALENYNKAIANNSKKPAYYLARALVYEKTNMPKYAFNDFNTAITLNPNLSDAWLGRGRMYLQQGNKKQACLNWEKANELGNYNANKLIYEHCTQ